MFSSLTPAKNSAFRVLQKAIQPFDVSVCITDRNPGQAIQAAGLPNNGVHHDAALPYAVVVEGQKIKYSIGATHKKGEGSYGGVYRAVIEENPQELPSFAQGKFGFRINGDFNPQHTALAIKVINNRGTENYNTFVENRSYVINEVKFLKLIYEDWANSVAYMSNDYFSAIVMPLIIGKSLHDFVEKSRINLTVFLDLAIKLMNAVLYIGSKNVVHRDLKLDNIMMLSNSNFEMKIIDFGEAAYVGSNILQHRVNTLSELPHISNDRKAERPAAPVDIQVQFRHDYFSAAFCLGTLLERVKVSPETYKEIQDEILKSLNHYHFAENQSNVFFSSTKEFLERKSASLRPS